MSEPASQPPVEDNTMTPFEREEPTFVPTPMQAPLGEAPEQLLGKRLAAARMHYSLNVEALARLTKAYDVDYANEARGISPASLARYEAGDSSPGAREIRLLCEALAISAQWLVFGDVGSSGKSKEEQALLDALNSYMVRKVAEQNDGALMSSEFSEWTWRQRRAQRLREARTPNPPKSQDSTKTG